MFGRMSTVAGSFSDLPRVLPLPIYQVLRRGSIASSCPDAQSASRYRLLRTATHRSNGESVIYRLICFGFDILNVNNCDRVTPSAEFRESFFIPDSDRHICGVRYGTDWSFGAGRENERVRATCPRLVLTVLRVPRSLGQRLSSVKRAFGLASFPVPTLTEPRE